MATIKEFTAAVKSNGLARANRYAVVLNLPKSMLGFNAKTVEKAVLFCDQIQLPGVNFSTSQNRSFGEFRETPYEKLYEHINMSFYMDKDMQVKVLFDQWHSNIYNPTTRTFNYYDQYTSDITIEVQDGAGKPTYWVTLHECYPKSIGAVQLDYASKDIMKLSVSMAYKWYETSYVAPSELADGLPKNALTDRLMNIAIGTAGAYAVTKLPALQSKLSKITSKLKF
jgi:hypothetical protein